MSAYKTNSSNDFYLNPQLLPEAKRLSDLYDILQENGYSSGEPELHFRCAEAVTSWITKQEKIIGAVMNIRDEGILEKLRDTKKTKILINYDKFMHDKNNWQFKKVAKHYDDLDCSRDKRLKVFYNKKSVKGEEQKWFDKRKPDLMHHKFLIGWEDEDDELSCSLLMGSFNMSTTSPQSLDSILIFRQNQRLCRAYYHIAMALFQSCLSWRDIKGVPEEVVLFFVKLQQYIRSKPLEEQEQIISELKLNESSISGEKLANYLAKRYGDISFLEGGWIEFDVD